MGYVEKVLGLVGERDPVELMEEFPRELRRELQAVPDERLRRPEGPGKWSVWEIVHHLADTELVYGYRLRVVLTIDRPEFSRFHQERWAERFSYLDLPLEDGLRRLEALREWHLGLIRGIGEKEMERVGVHSSRREETVERMIGLWAGHDLLHLGQVRRILLAQRREEL